MEFIHYMKSGLCMHMYNSACPLNRSKLLGKGMTSPVVIRQRFILAQDTNSNQLHGCINIGLLFEACQSPRSSSSSHLLWGHQSPEERNAFT